MPPVPSGDWISYGPSLVPEVSPIYARNYSSDRGSSTQSNEVQSSRRSTGDCRCQFWCQLVLRFGALSCALVLFLATQSVDSVTSCSSVRFDARTSVGLRVSCSASPDAYRLFVCFLVLRILAVLLVGFRGRLEGLTRTTVYSGPRLSKISSGRPGPMTFI